MLQGIGLLPAKCVEIFSILSPPSIVRNFAWILPLEITDVKKCLYQYLKNRKKNLQGSVDGGKNRRRKKFQHHIFIFYETALFCVVERCMMCIVAVHADVKKGKDNLSTWLVCKYV